MREATGHGASLALASSQVASHELNRTPIRVHQALRETVSYVPVLERGFIGGVRSFQGLASALDDSVEAR